MPYKDLEKKRAYQRQWLAKRKKKYQATHCRLCYKKDKYLELDHINPDDKSHHCIWSWAIPRLEKELKKCQWLCRACHAAKSKREDEEWKTKNGAHTHRPRAFDGSAHSGRKRK